MNAVIAVSVTGPESANLPWTQTIVTRVLRSEDPRPSIFREAAGKNIPPSSPRRRGSTGVVDSRLRGNDGKPVYFVMPLPLSLPWAGDIGLYRVRIVLHHTKGYKAMKAIKLVELPGNIPIMKPGVIKRTWGCRRAMEAIHSAAIYFTAP